jgi:fibronectin-binding autotransporter adhesin
VTTDGVDSAAGLVLAAAAILNIVSGTSFTIYDFIHGAGTVAINSSGSDPTLFIDGTVSLVGGGTIKMLGPTGEDFILGTGNGGALINVDYTIEGTGTIGGGDGRLTFENFGTVNANDGLLTINTGNQVYNDGLMEATAGGTLQIEDSIANAGTVEADGAAAAVQLSGATFDNLFSVVAENGGNITFTNVGVTNEAISATDPVGGTINADGGTITFDGGSVTNGNMMEATDGGILQFENITVTNSSAAQLTVDPTSEIDLTNADVLGGTVDNAGNVIVTAGSSALESDIVINDGKMTIDSGASLTLQDTTLISDTGSGLLALNAGAALSLYDASVEGITIAGTTTDFVANSTIDVAGDSTLTDVTLTNGGLTVEGEVTLSMEGNSTFDGVTVTDKGSIQIDDSEVSATLIVDDNSTITGGTLSIGSAATLDVETGADGLPGYGATLGHVNVIEADSKLDVEHGGATLGGVSVIDDGTIQMDSGAILALYDDSIWGSGLIRINAGSTLDADGGTTAIDLGGTILNTATIEASAGATLDVASNVDNTSGELLAAAGGKLDIESAISGGSATIQHATLEFDASSNVNVTFDNSGGYGLLLLGDAEHFSGTISDFTGTSAANSDVIDLTDINYNSESFHESYDSATGVLTVTDGTHTAELNFDDFTGTFKFASNGVDGTDIYDPPAGGSKDTPARATTASGNDQVTPQANQNGSVHDSAPANHTAFGWNQGSATAVDLHDGGDATLATNQWVPPAGGHAFDSGQVSGATAEAGFGGDQAAAGNSSEADVGALTNGSNGGFSHTLLSSLLNVLSDNTSPIAVVAPNAPVLDSEHPTYSTVVDGSGAANGADTSSTPPTVPTNEHAGAPATVTPPPAAASPTVASASFGGLGNDNFAFHPNLGSDTAHTTGAQTNELVHGNVQIGGPALASIALEFHQEFAFDAIHQDAANHSVDQFHQMAANSTLLH